MVHYWDVNNVSLQSIALWIFEEFRLRHVSHCGQIRTTTVGSHGRTIILLTDNPTQLISNRTRIFLKENQYPYKGQHLNLSKPL